MKFKRQAHFRYKRVGESWRKPRGMHNKVRKYEGGKMASPAIGYATSRKSRGKHPSGYEEVLVNTPSDIEKLNSENQAIRISGRVGKRKKILIQKKAEELKFKILNPSSFEEPEKEEEEKEEEK